MTLQDPRLAVRQDLSGGEWQLVIRDVNHGDAGQYECQINTSPVLSHTISLAVVGKEINKAKCPLDAVETPLSLLHCHTLCFIGLHCEIGTI